MFKYRFECRSCEKRIEYKEDTPLLPTCPICQGALDIEANFSGEEWTPIPHAVLVDFEIEKKMMDFVTDVSGKPQVEVRENIRTNSSAYRQFDSVKHLIINLVMKGAEGEEDIIKRRFEEETHRKQLLEMADRGVITDKLDRGNH